jgi:hypothetical protein
MNKRTPEALGERFKNICGRYATLINGSYFYKSGAKEKYYRKKYYGKKKNTSTFGELFPLRFQTKLVYA